MSIVLVGKIGVGKTTFYNKITRATEETKYGGASQTLSVFMKQSCEGRGFKVLDTPGLGTESGKVDHIAGILSALSQGPVNRIFLVTKFERTDTIISEIRSLIPAFMKFRVLITVALTFWDKCKKEDEEKNKKEISQRLEKLKINSVIFVSEDDTPQNLCEQIDDIIDHSSSQQVQLTDDDIFQNFDLNEYEDDDQLLEMENKKADLITKFQKFYKQAVAKIEEATCPDAHLPDYLNAITKFTYTKLEDTIRDFEKSLIAPVDKLPESDQLRAFQYHFELQSTLFRDYENIVEKSVKRTNSVNGHFSKFIKKCKFCGLVWIKVQGCDGQTVCGRLLSGTSDAAMSAQIPQKYQVSYLKDKLEVNHIQEVQSSISQKQISEINTNLQTTEAVKKEFREVPLGGTSKEMIGKMGCGNIIEWNQMLNLTEEQMTEVLRIMDSQLYEYMEKQEKLLKAKAQAVQAKYSQQLKQSIQKHQEMTQVSK